jgi:hypothetical protein
MSDFAAMSDAIRYWLVNSGTTDDPWVDRLPARYRDWNAAQGDVQGFSRRPTSITVGDVLIHRAVGTDGNRLVAVGNVIGAPRETNDQWPWRLPRRLTFVCETVDAAPRATDLGIDAFQMRTYKELDPEIGSRAAKAIAVAGQPWV